MTPRKSGHSGHVPFVLDAGNGDEESTKVPPWCVPFGIAHHPVGEGAGQHRTMKRTAIVPGFVDSVVDRGP